MALKLPVAPPSQFDKATDARFAASGHQPRAERGRFADWIPEVLAELAALADLAEPPESDVIDQARREVSRRRPGFPRPTIKLLDLCGAAVEVCYGKRGYIFLANRGMCAYGWED